MMNCLALKRVLNLKSERVFCSRNVILQVYDSPDQLCNLVEAAFTELLEREFPDVLTVEDNQALQEQLTMNSYSTITQYLKQIRRLLIFGGG